MIIYYFILASIGATNELSQDAAPLNEDKFNIDHRVTIQHLFEARLHLGHKHGVSNQLMRQYIYGIRSGCHIFDLNLTLSHLKRALIVAGSIAERNGIILFVNSRSQFDRLVRDTAKDCGEYVLSPRWRPGTFTNSYMTLSTHTLPDLLILLSTATNPITLREATMCNIPTISLSDSDSDPRLVTYTVPGNDDTPSSVRLYCELFRDVIKSAKETKD